MNVLLMIAIMLIWVGSTAWLWYSRDIYRDSARNLAAELRDLRRLSSVPPQRPLTPPNPKVQDSPKRYTGQQLRRMAEQVNVATWEGLQERPNSEVLQEQENG